MCHVLCNAKWSDNWAMRFRGVTRGSLSFSTTHVSSSFSNATSPRWIIAARTLKSRYVVILSYVAPLMLSCNDWLPPIRIFCLPNHYRQALGGATYLVILMNFSTPPTSVTLGQESEYKWGGDYEYPSEKAFPGKFTALTPNIPGRFPGRLRAACGQHPISQESHRISAGG